MVRIDQALAREAIQGVRLKIAQRCPGSLPDSCDVVVASGSILARGRNPGETALVVLDALETAGVTRLLLDATGIGPPLGALAAIDATAAVELLAAGCLLELGTVIAPSGPVRAGRRALRCTITRQDGADSDVAVRYGDLKVVPLSPGESADVTIRPRRRVDGGRGQLGRGGTARVYGGVVGLIIDARGRPLRIAADPLERVREARLWLAAIGGRP
jgi:hypothetical protein